MKTKTITFNCEIVTPMFIGDATGGSELRPPAIKAALRFWWRAMHAHLSLENLKSTEISIFGGGGENARRSSFDLSISRDQISPITFSYNKNKDLKPLSFLRKREEGLDYFFYTFVYLKKEGEYLPSKSAFDIVFQFNNEETIKPILASFWALVHLGNIGSRSRRGVGGFRVINENKKHYGLSFAQENSLDFYSANFNTISEMLKIADEQTINTYSNLIGANIYMANNTFSSWENALNDVGVKMKNFRLDDDGKKRITDKQSAGFGLPVAHAKYYTITAKSYERRASPIIIKIIQEDQKYSWIITHLKGYFLFDNKAHNELVKVEGKGKSKKITDIGKIDSSKLQSFLMQFSKNSIQL